MYILTGNGIDNEIPMDVSYYIIHYSSLSFTAYMIQHHMRSFIRIRTSTWSVVWLDKVYTWLKELTCYKHNVIFSSCYTELLILHCRILKSGQISCLRWYLGNSTPCYRQKTIVTPCLFGSLSNFVMSFSIHYCCAYNFPQQHAGCHLVQQVLRFCLSFAFIWIIKIKLISWFADMCHILHVCGTWTFNVKYAMHPSIALRLRHKHRSIFWKL
jgi:hypothetical protein